ncbi:hypothetical protein, partial [Bacillus mycoides]|uniref:hypothetical protein n=1 Tax=Bacillus mycoides TaxID=1405 RepID=UPI003D66157B
HKRISRFDLDSFSDWSLFFFMFSNRKHVFGMPCFLTKLSSYKESKGRELSFSTITILFFRAITNTSSRN